MIAETDTRAVACSTRLYHALLLIYPRAYRAQYASPMTQLFRDQCRDAWVKLRSWGLVALWLRVLPDLVRTSLLEHIANWKGKKTMAENISDLGRPRSSRFTVFLGVGAAVFVLTFLAAAIITLMLPQSFSSRARIHIAPDQSAAAGPNGQTASGGYDPYFIQTQFEVIQSDLILAKVIEKLDLTTKWMAIYGGGEKMRINDALVLLRQRIDLRPVRNTSLVEIYVYGQNPTETADIANAIAEVYRVHRLNQQLTLAKNGLESLKEQMDVQEEKVRAARDEVDRLRRELRITDYEAMGSAPMPSLDADLVRRLQGELISYDTMLEKEKAQLAELRKLKPEERVNVIGTAVGQDNELSALTAELNLAEQNLIKLQKDFDVQHPNYKNAKAIAEDSQARVLRRVDGIMMGLSNRVAGLEAAATATRANLERARAADFSKVELTRPYYEAKVRLEEMQHFRSVLSMKLSSERTEGNRPRSMLVDIIDRAQPGLRPVRPNKALNLFIGAGSGMVLALLIGGGMAWLFSTSGKKPGGPLAPA